MRGLGFPLFETGEVEDANRVLYEVLKSREARLWEGFPILLVNASRDGKFDYDKIMSLCKNQKEKDRLLDFFVLSLAIYKYFHVQFLWENKIYKQFSGDKKKKVDIFLQFLRKNSDLRISDQILSSTRVKNIFENYFEEERTAEKRSSEKYEELSLEYALSQIFPPKQKSLFFKKLRGEKMTKTEREYYSRQVKKKVMALSNSKLHRLARKILES
jgi:hypothetical protein